MGWVWRELRVGSPGNSLTENRIAHIGTVGGSPGVRIESTEATGKMPIVSRSGPCSASVGLHGTGI